MCCPVLLEVPHPLLFLYLDCARIVYMCCRSTTIRPTTGNVRAFLYVLSFGSPHAATHSLSLSLSRRRSISSCLNYRFYPSSPFFFVLSFGSAARGRSFSFTVSTPFSSRFKYSFYPSSPFGDYSDIQILRSSLSCRGTHTNLCVQCVCGGGGGWVQRRKQKKLHTERT